MRHINSPVICIEQTFTLKTVLIWDSLWYKLNVIVGYGVYDTQNIIATQVFFFFFKCSVHLWINNAISWSIKIYSTSYQSFILLCSLHGKTRFHFVPLFTQQNLDFRGSSFSCYNNHLLKKNMTKKENICFSKTDEWLSAWMTPSQMIHGHQHAQCKCPWTFLHGFKSYLFALCSFPTCNIPDPEHIRRLPWWAIWLNTNIALFFNWNLPCQLYGHESGSVTCVKSNPADGNKMETFLINSAVIQYRDGISTGIP